MLTVSVRSLITISLSWGAIVLNFEIDVTVAFLDLLVGNLADEILANVVAEILHRMEFIRLYVRHNCQ